MKDLKQIALVITPKWLLDLYFEEKAKTEYAKWEKQNRPIPPSHAVKKFTIREYQKKSGYNILVETGTYQGMMVFAQLNYFKNIYSIELAEYYYNRACKIFKKHNKVHLLQGDSSIELGNILKDLSEPVIFWLDGHYSGEKTAKGTTNCPIWAEIEHIVNHHFPHIILIDDARCFIGENDYPTIEELRQYFMDKGICDSFEVKDDIIRIILKERKTGIVSDFL
jgi:hypothetical protein